MHFSNLAAAALFLSNGAFAIPQTAKVGPAALSGTEFADLPLPIPRGLPAGSCPQQVMPEEDKKFAIYGGNGVNRANPATQSAKKIGKIDPKAAPAIFANGLNALAFVTLGPPPPRAEGAPEIHCQFMTKTGWELSSTNPITTTSFRFIPGERYAMTFKTSRTVRRAAIKLVSDKSSSWVWDTTFPAAPSQKAGSGPAGWIEFAVKEEVRFSFALDLGRGQSNGEIALYTLGAL